MGSLFVVKEGCIAIKEMKSQVIWNKNLTNPSALQKQLGYTFCLILG
jgi:hypothetical protein